MGFEVFCGEEMILFLGEDDADDQCRGHDVSYEGDFGRMCAKILQPFTAGLHAHDKSGENTVEEDGFGR